MGSSAFCTTAVIAATAAMMAMKRQVTRVPPLVPNTDRAIQNVAMPIAVVASAIVVAAASTESVCQADGAANDVMRTVCLSGSTCGERARTTPIGSGTIWMIKTSRMAISEVEPAPF